MKIELDQGEEIEVVAGDRVFRIRYGFGKLQIYASHPDSEGRGDDKVIWSDFHPPLESPPHMLLGCAECDVPAGVPCLPDCSSHED